MGLSKESESDDLGKRFVPPSSVVTEQMMRFAQTDDLWHFAQNLNAMMKYGYCPRCGIVPWNCRCERGVIEKPRPPN